MRKIVSGAVLFLAVLPAFAQPDAAVSLPEPGVLSLVALGGAVLALSRRSKK